MKKTFCLFLCLMSVSLMLVACVPDPADSTATTSGDSGSAEVPTGNETTTPTPEDESTASEWSVTTDENGGIELPPIPIP